MDKKLETYRNIVKHVLAEQAEHPPSHGQIETTPVFDDTTNNYMIVDVGWDKPGRVHAVLLHLGTRKELSLPNSGRRDVNEPLF